METSFTMEKSHSLTMMWLLLGLFQGIITICMTRMGCIIGVKSCLSTIQTALSMGKTFFYMDNQSLFIYEDQAYYWDYDDSLYVPHLSPQQLALLKEGNTPLRELFPSQDDKQKNKEIDTTGFEELSYPFWRHQGQIYHLIYKEWYDSDQHDWKSERRYVVVKGYDNASLRVDTPMVS